MTGRERVFVVVSGVPGSGKTTLARPLAQSLGLPLISKDVIKERLFDGLGVDDLEWSRQLGQASVKVLFALAADAGAAVVDNAWSSEHSPADLAGLGAPLVEVFCDCPVELAASRFEARLATRHPGHVDATRDPRASWPASRPLGVGPVVAVDTTGPVDVAGVADMVRAQPGWPGGRRETGPVLHNLTVHVAPDRLEEVRSFYTEALGLVAVFEDAGHLCCLDASGGRGGMALCIHEAEPALPRAPGSCSSGSTTPVRTGSEPTARASRSGRSSPLTGSRSWRSPTRWATRSASTDAGGSPRDTATSVGRRRRRLGPLRPGPRGRPDLLVVAPSGLSHLHPRPGAAHA